MSKWFDLAKFSSLSCAVLFITACPTPAGLDTGPERGPVTASNDAGVANPCVPDPCSGGQLCTEVDGNAACACPDGEVLDDTGTCGADLCAGACDPTQVCDTTGACICNPDFFEDDGAGGCAAILADLDLSTVAGQIDANDPSATYDVTVHVVDTQGTVLIDVPVTADSETEVRTDLRGEALLTGLVYADPHRLSITRAGYFTQDRMVFQADRVEVVMVEQGPTVTLSGTSGGTISNHGASVSFAPGTLLISDLEAATGDVDIQVTGFDLATNRQAFPADTKAVTDDGSATVFTPLAAIDVVITGGRKVAPLPGATLRFLLPSTAHAAAGDRLPLWSYDAETGLWHLDSSCEVQTAPAERAFNGQTLECEGTVSHFTTWAVGPQDPILCAELTLPSFSLPKYLLRSNGVIDDISARATGPDSGSYKDRTADNWTVVNVDNSTTPATRKLKVGVRQSALGSATPTFFWLLHRDGAGTDSALQTAAISFTLPTGKVLSASSTFGTPGDTCTPIDFSGVTISVTEAEFNSDTDEDGYFGAGTFGRPVDCLDEEGFPGMESYPGAPETCSFFASDTNCDGNLIESGSLTLDAAIAQGISPERFNGPLCNDGCVDPFTAEVPGNAYDENCDGTVDFTDADGDGEASLQNGGTDCDDTDASRNAAAIEVAGNKVDENCDGTVIDGDGDGILATRHIAFAADFPTLSYGDCDDTDATTKPGAATALEAIFADGGAYFAGNTRNAAYCSLFDAAGLLKTTLAKRIVVDKNCDGLATDLDGDGLRAPGDPELSGNPDCDDTDPRVGDGGGDCASIDRSAFIDESACTPNQDQFDLSKRGTVQGAFCPAVAGVDSICVNSGVQVCALPGYLDRPPETPLVGGRPWSPCATGAGLPACPGGTICGFAPQTLAWSGYTQAYKDAVVAANSGADFTGVNASGLGMCFPLCNLTTSN